MIGCYPGSFDPPTIGHLAVAEAALATCGLERLDLVLSEAPLGKPAAAPLDQRSAALEAAVAGIERLAVARTTARLLVDVCAGYDVLVVGADKWAQVCDPSWYGSERARDEALARLPLVAVAPRAGWALPRARPGRIEVLPVDPAVLSVSSSEVRTGRRDWAAPIRRERPAAGRPRPRGGS